MKNMFNFLLILFLASNTINSQQYLTSVSVSGNNGLFSEVPNCFFDSVENIVARLESNVEKLSELCKIDSNIQIKNLIQLADDLSDLEIYQRKKPEDVPKDTTKKVKETARLASNWTATQKVDDYANAMSLNPFPGNLNNLQLSVWKALGDDLDSLVNNFKLSAYYRDKIWKIMRSERHVNVLRSLYENDLRRCLPTNYRDAKNYEELGFIVGDDFHPEGHKCKDQAVDFSLDSFYLMNDGGIAVTFWVPQNLADISSTVKIFEGYTNNKKVLDFSLYRASASNVGNRFNVGEENIEFPSTSQCSENSFVFISIQRDCENYKLLVAIRFLGSNSRYSFERQLTSDFVENMKIQFNPKYANTVKMYSDFTYTPDRELILMYAGTSNDLQKEIVLLSEACAKKPAFCDYQANDECIVCGQNYFKYDKTCVLECPKKYFKTAKECLPCHASCSDCFGEKNSQCNKCVSPFVLHDKTCKDSCPLNMFAVDGECKVCKDFCLECLDALNCRKCDAIHYLYKGSCYDVCPISSFPQINPNTCQDCDSNCEKCEALNKCFTCRDGFYLKNGICVKDCGDTFLNDQLTKTCKKCSDKCLNCTDEKTCTKCMTGYNLLNGECTTDCPEKTVSYMGVCVPCKDPHCLTCWEDDVSVCDRCDRETFLKDGQCVNNCGDGFFAVDRDCIDCKIEFCRTCNKEKCFTCMPGKLLLEDKKCVDTCPDGYVEKNNSCIKCKNPTVCKKCDVSNLEMCTKCYDGKLFQEGRCVMPCDEGFFKKDFICSRCIENCKSCNDEFTCEKCKDEYFKKGNQCVRDCGVGFVPINGECKACPVSGCAECDKLQLTTCTKCISPKYLFTNQCYDKCPSQTFHTSDFKCENCIRDCEICNDKLSCDKCLSPKVLQGNNCVNECLDNFINIGGKCTQCKNSNCRKCDQNLTVCIDCPVGKFLYNGECLNSCPSQTYVEANLCLPCVKPCKECSDKNTCLSCVDKFALFENKCTDDCPETTIKVIDKCVKCTATRCLKCKENLSECITCQNNLFLLEGKCYDKCPDGYYGLNGICTPCLPECKSCDSSTKCKECFENKYLKNENTCVSDCENNYIDLIQNNIKICKPCVNNCLKCQPNDPNYCTKCPKDLVLYQGSCRTECPEGFIKNSITSVCEACNIKNCSTCPTIDSCSKCRSDSLLHLGNCIQPPCPDQFTQLEDKCIKCEIKNCKTCPSNNTKICTDCIVDNFLFKNEKCDTTCPATTYKNLVNKKCENCSNNCLYCLNSNICTKCDSGFYLHEQSCVKECPLGFTIVDDRCQKCEVEGCQSCPGNYKICTECTSTLYLAGNKCDKTCPEKNFSNDKRICNPCLFECEKCENENVCTKCIPGKVLTLNNKCTDNCPDGTVEDNGICKKCLTDEKCKKCDPANLSQCKQCKNDLVLYKNVCESECPNNFFQNQGVCHPCIAFCEKCTDHLSCQVCENGFYLFEGKCKSDCPNGFYKFERRCVACEKNCDVCDSNACTKCTNGTFLEMGKCVVPCTRGFYLKDNTECFKCPETCVDCNSPNSCKICKEGFNKKNGECVKECGIGYVVINGICTPCETGCLKCNPIDPKKCETAIPERVIHEGIVKENCPLTSFRKPEINECDKCIDNCLVCPDNKICTGCKEGFFVNYDGKCVNKCEDGYTALEGKCKPCEVQKCKVCDKNIKQCESCLSPLALYNNECKTECPLKTYREENLCKDCTTECKTCENKDVCTSCIDNFNLQNNKCISECLPEYVAVKGVCKKCTTPDCKLCETNTEVCLNCNTNKILYTFTNKEGNSVTECRDTCPEKFFKNEKNQCQKCIDSCLTCTNDRDCIACVQGKVLQDGKCQDRCNVGYVERNGVCLKCVDNNCAVCDNINLAQCNICTTGFALKGNQCVTDCGDKYFRVTNNSKEECNGCITNCKICRNGTTCDECDVNYLLKENKCVPTCGDNYISKDKKYCEKCADPNCKQCDNNTSKCITCTPPFYKQNDKCVTNCLESFYASPDDYVCKACIDQNCLKCAPQNVCTLCSSNMFLYNDKCVIECPAGYVSNEDKNCVKCADSDCKKCANTKENQCIGCFLKFLHKNECLNSCPNGTYPTEDRICLPCPATCSSCVSETECTFCITNFTLDFDKKCKDQCSPGSISIDGKCVKCKAENCEKCDKNNLEHCILCDPKFYLYKGHCDDKCPAHTFLKDNSCHDCLSQCESCNNHNSCLSCKTTFLQGDQCINECNSGFVPNEERICKECKDTNRCHKCEKDKRDVCITCKEGYVLDDKECKEKCSNGKFSVNQVCKECTTNCSECETADTCKVCTAPWVLNNGKCIKDCPDGFIPLLGKCTECKNKNCKTCDAGNLDYCLSCNSPLFVYKNDCIKDCPSETYFDGATCKNCGDNCLTCDATQCKKCKKDFNLDKGECKGTCPPGTTSRDGECLACSDPFCLSCVPTNLNSCNVCKDSFLLNNICYKECPEGYRGDKNICVPCGANCSKCNDKECLKCKANYFFLENTKSCVECLEPNLVVNNETCATCKKDGCLKCKPNDPNACKLCKGELILHKEECLSDCPPKMYKGENTCLNCSDNCQTCKDGNTCNKCVDPFVLFNGLCKTSCPPGFVKDKDNVCQKCNQDECLTCSAQDKNLCLKCKDGILTYKNLCYTNCPENTYKNDNTCSECPVNCRTCDGTKCLSCKDQFKILGNTCIDKCPTGYLDDGKYCLQCNDLNCLECNPTNICKKCNDSTYLDKQSATCKLSCPEKTFVNEKKRECEECGVGCIKCDVSQCKLCSPNLFLEDGVCVSRCKDGSTNLNGACVKCIDSNCLQCFPDDPSKCLKCSSPLLLYNFECRNDCPKSTFKLDNTCNDCHPSCSDCNSLTDCLKCKNEFKIEKGLCTNTCPDGKVLFNNEKCISCADQNCKTCLTVTSQCISCNKPYYLVEESCKDSCPDGYFPGKDNNVCNKCAEGCEKCTGLDQCEKCINGFFLDNGKCGKTCPSNFYSDCNEHKCKQCNSACKECFDKDPASCINCADIYYKSDKECVLPINCKPGTYPDQDRKECRICSIAFCSECQSENVCKTCLRGFQMKDGKCIESSTITNVFVPSNLFTTFVSLNQSERQQYSFNNQLKGTAVGSNNVSFSFWIRRLNQADSGTFYWRTFTTNTNTSLRMTTKATSEREICQFSYVSSSNIITSLDTVDCSFNGLKEWKFFTVTFSKSKDNSGFLKVYTSGDTKIINFSTTVPIDLDQFIQKETKLQFNQNNLTYDAFEVADFNIMDYNPTDSDIEKLSKNKPNKCDYMCSDCKGICFKCSNGLLDSNSYCPAAFVPIKQMVSSIDQDSKVDLRDKINKNVNSDRFALTFFFYVSNLDKSNSLSLASLYYDTYNSSIQLKNVLANISLVNNKIVLNEKYIFNNPDIIGNKWYMISFGFINNSSTMYLRDLTGAVNYKQTTQFPINSKLFDDLIVLYGNTYGSQNTTHIKGSIAQVRLYINNIPTDAEIFEFSKLVSCPDNCSQCNQDFSCAKCIPGFKVGIDGKCVDNTLESATLLLEKMSIWNKDSLDLTIPEQVYSDKYSISLWVRKKRHSLENTQINIHNVLSINDNTRRIPLITQTLNSNYVSEFAYIWMDKKLTFTHDFRDEIYEYIHFVLNFDSVSNTLEYNIKDKSQTYNAVDNFNSKFKTIILGDNNGQEMNIEVALVSYYPQILSKENIEKVRSQPPKDCDPACLECNYFTGICKTCITRNDKSFNVDKCPAFSKGRTVNLYNKKSYAEITNLDTYSVKVSDDFKKDVNSKQYSIIGWFRALEWQKYLSAKNGKYSILTVSNFDYAKNKDPGCNIISIEIVIENGMASLNWVIDEVNNPRYIPFNPQPNLDNNKWILFHAGINVDEKTFNYKFFSDGNISDTKSISLDNYPEKLTEYATMKLFGIGRTLESDYKIGNGSAFETYLFINRGFSDITFNYFINSNKPGLDPVCPQNCLKCFKVDEAVICATCSAGYLLNKNICEPPIVTSYQLLNDRWDNIFKQLSFKIDKFNYSNLSAYSVSFFFRRNYHRISDTKYNIFTLGNLKLSSEIVSNVFFLVLDIDGVSGSTQIGPIDADNNLDYRWYAVTITITETKVTVNVKNLDKSNVDSKIINISKSIKHDSSLSVQNPNYEFEIYNIHVIDKDVDFPVVDSPSYNQCIYDCDICDNGSCKGCVYGFNNDGSCKKSFITFNNKKVSTATYLTENKISINDHIGKSKLLRSNIFTLFFSFEFNTTADSFRVIKLTNSNVDSEPNTQITNMITLTYTKSLKKFNFKFTNRYLGVFKKVIEYEAILPLDVQSNIHYVFISFDGVSKNIVLYVSNNKSNFVRKDISFEGFSDYITNYAYLFLTNYFDTGKVGVTENITYRDFRFYPSSINDLINTSLIENLITPIQTDCIVSNRSKCIKCSTKLINGICTQNNSLILWENIMQATFLHNDYSIKFKSFLTNKLTISFWWRRTSYNLSDMNVLKLSGNEKTFANIKQIIEVNYSNNNFVVTGGIGTLNKFIVPTIYDTNEQFDWLHVTIAYDIIPNNMSVYIVNSETSRSNVKQSITSSTNNGVASGIPIGLSTTQINYAILFAARVNDIAFNFEFSNFIFSSDSAYDATQAGKFRPKKPRACNACQVDCQAEVCPVNSIIKSEFEISDVFVGSEELKSSDIAIINKVPLFRYLAITNPEFDTQSTLFNNYMISMELNIPAYLNNKYVSNKDVLFAMSNNVSTDNLDLKMADLIPESVYKFGVIGIQHRDGNLRIYTGGNEDTKYVYYKDINIENKLSSYSNVYIVILFDGTNRLTKGYVYLDDIAISIDFDGPNPPQPITIVTMFYNHPALTAVRINVNNPRFDYDYERNYYNKSIFTQVNPNLNNCLGADKNCQKCMKVDKTTQFGCLKCKPEFKILQNNVCFASQNK